MILGVGALLQCAPTMFVVNPLAPTILAIETSSDIGSVCVWVPDAPDACEIEATDSSIKLSAWLLPAIKRALAKSGRQLTDIDAIAFGAGPGSFTGVRTACATAQALAYAHGKPLIAVNCLDAFADLCDALRIAVAFDARMNEIYAANYVRGITAGSCDANGELPPCDNVVLTAPKNYRAPDTSFVYIGSGVKLLDASLGIDLSKVDTVTHDIESRWAEGVARVAVRKFARFEFTEPLAAEPIYVRNKVALTEAERAAA
jgi:tRNA threonylcarbamoyladenosine biosynthesis protein TsaB